MYELKKMEKYFYEYICWNRALVLCKKNLSGRGLTKVVKHCSIWNYNLSVIRLGRESVFHCKGV